MKTKEQIEAALINMKAIADTLTSACQVLATNHPDTDYHAVTMKTNTPLLVSLELGQHWRMPASRADATPTKSEVQELLQAFELDPQISPSKGKLKNRQITYSTVRFEWSIYQQQVLIEEEGNA